MAASLALNSKRRLGNDYREFRLARRRRRPPMPSRADPSRTRVEGSGTAEIESVNRTLSTRAPFNPGVSLANVR